MLQLRKSQIADGVNLTSSKQNPLFTAILKKDRRRQQITREHNPIVEMIESLEREI